MGAVLIGRAAYLLLLVVACAPKPKPATARAKLSGDDLAMAMKSAGDVALKMQKAQDRASASCAALKAQPILPAEQLEVGRTMIARAGVERVGPLGTDEGLTGYLSTVGRQLARHSAQPDLDWTFGYGDAEPPRSFSAVGGYVFISKGMLAMAANEAQLAALLAPQIALVASGRPLQVYSDMRTQLCLPMATMDEMNREGLADSVPMSLQQFGGKPELLMERVREAALRTSAEVMLTMANLRMNEKPREDELMIKESIGLLAAAGYSPAEYEAVWKKLEATPEQLTEAATLRKKLPKGQAPKLKRPLKPSP